MSSTEEKSTPFHLKNTNYSSDLFLLTSFVAFTLLLSFGVTFFYSMQKIKSRIHSTARMYAQS